MHAGNANHEPSTGDTPTVKDSPKCKGRTALEPVPATAHVRNAQPMWRTARPQQQPVELNTHLHLRNA